MFCTRVACCMGVFGTVCLLLCREKGSSPLFFAITEFALGLLDLCDSSTACRLCRLEPVVPFHQHYCCLLTPPCLLFIFNPETAGVHDQQLSGSCRHLPEGKSLLMSAPKSTVTLFTQDTHQFQTHPDITLP